MQDCQYAFEGLLIHERCEVEYAYTHICLWWRTIIKTWKKFHENIPDQASFASSRRSVQYDSTRKMYILMWIWDYSVKSMEARLTEFPNGLFGKLPKFEDGPHDFFYCLIVTDDTNLRDINTYTFWYCWTLTFFYPICVIQMQPARTSLKGYRVASWLIKFSQSYHNFWHAHITPVYRIG